MYFDLLHPGILILLNGVIMLVTIKSQNRLGNLKKTPLDKLLLGLVSSILWLLYGYYRHINVNILLFETFAIGLTLMGLVLKLDMDKDSTFLGKPIPGYGAKEGSVALIIKKILSIILLTAVILVVIAAIIFNVWS